MSFVQGRELAREVDRDAIAAFSQAGLCEAEPDASPAGPPARRGRGARINPGNRYEPTALAPFDDGWETLTEDFAALPPLPTTLTRDASRTAIAWNESPDIGFDRAVNPYRGCEHGCVYCYARRSHAYLGHSPGLDFETKLLFKPDVAQLLERELAKPGYVPRPIALGSNTDCYQPVERTLKLTRAVLEVLERCSHPLTIVTKSAGVLRDIDLLTALAKRRLVRVYLSVTTLDAGLARRLEPRAATPARRLEAVRVLSAADVPTGVLAAPMIPGLNDAELERILDAAKAAGAGVAGYVLLRLPYELKQIVEDWLHTHVPNRARRVLELIRETRAGHLNDSRFGHRFAGSGPYAELLASRFDRAARAHGFARGGELDCTQFRPPARTTGNGAAQLSLL